MTDNKINTSHRISFLEPAGRTTLYAEGAGDGGDDCGEELQYLRHVAPVYFDHCFTVFLG